MSEKKHSITQSQLAELVFDAFREGGKDPEQCTGFFSAPAYDPYDVIEVTLASGEILALRRPPKVNTESLKHLYDVSCPSCGASMELRRRRRDGHEFYECSTFPECRLTLEIQDGAPDDDWDDEWPDDSWHELTYGDFF